jgi:NADH-quinone oxidoreductase subunit M
MLVLVGAFVHSPWAAAFAVLGIVLAAIYVLWLYQRTMTGPVTAGVTGMRDLTLREVGALAPLVLLIIVLGFFPKPLLSVINPSVHHTMAQVGKTDPKPTVQAGEAAK